MEERSMKQKRIPYNISDISGRRYGNLVALFPTGKSKNRSRIWQCQCDCGTLVEATVKDLNRGAKLSCGCRKKRPPAEGHAIKNNLHFVDGTCIEHLISAESRPVKNATGVKGVTHRKHDGKYVAYIGFQKRRIYLGTFENLDEAAEARKKAEYEFHEKYLKAYFKEKIREGKTNDDTSD